jgi:tetratricopeptide (TPR) repeat protein
MNLLRPLICVSMLLSGCAVPQPYQPSAPSQSVPPEQPGSTQTQPAPAPPPVDQSQPLPAPVIREPVLSPASRALVSQANTQLTSKNYAVAAASIERALRIEPDNPLLWIELGKVRQAEGNYVQAENMARKALTMSANAPRAQSSAWTLIAESNRARGRNTQAREAQMRAEQLR